MIHSDTLQAISRIRQHLLCSAALLLGLFLFAEEVNAQSGKKGISVGALIGNSVSDPDSIRYNDVAEAIKRFENRDQLSARTFLERAMLKDDTLPPVGVMMAKLHLLAGNSQGVRPALEQAVLEDSKDDPEPYLLLAEQALVGNRSIEAEALFEKADSLIEKFNKNPKRKRRFNIRVSNGMAIIAERREQWDKAMTYIDKWLQEDPEDASALTRKGQLLFMLDKEKEGFEAFQAARKINSELQSPYITAAMMYGRKGEDSKAKEAFKKAFSESSDDERTIIAYTQALMKDGDFEAAEKVFAEASKKLPKEANIWLLRGVNARMLGDLETAESHLMKAQGIAPSNRDVLNQLALLLIDSEESASLRRALSFANMNAQMNSDNPDVNITLAWALYKNGQMQQANAAVQKAVRGAMSADGQYLLAKMLILNDKKSDAKRLLEAALQSKAGIFVQRKEAEELLETL